MITSKNNYHVKKTETNHKQTVKPIHKNEIGSTGLHAITYIATSEAKHKEEKDESPILNDMFGALNYL